MSLINWTEDLALGILIIDEQHKKLIELINKLHEAMGSGSASAVLEEILKEMNSYAKYHFDTEEKYFDQFNYEGSETHKAQHQSFIKKTSDFYEQFKIQPTGLTIQVFNYLKSWLIDHIKGSDRKYIQCFKDNGLV